MSVYLDASVAVALLAAEPNGQVVRRWLATRPDGFAIVSWWGVTEVSSALARRRRTGELSYDRELAARALWQSAQGSSIRVVGVDFADFGVAAEFCARPNLVLRGGDALHLAAVQRLGLALATFDKGMAEAARRLGVPLQEIG